MQRMALIVLAGLLAASLAAADEKERTITFSKDDAGKLPAGWKAEQTGKGKGSVWKVVADRTAPSGTGHVLAQTAAGPDRLFNLCIATEGNYHEVDVCVAFKAVRGEKDQGGGIVWRYRDANNYYVARMNPLEDNYRLYKVVAGKRSRPLQSAAVQVKEGTWHTLRVTMSGKRINCYLDGKKYLEADDDTFSKPGKIGLWTKADAQTYFDKLKVSGK